MNQTYPTSEFAEVNEALHNWYTLAGSKNIFPACPQLTKKAKRIAQQLGKCDFKGSRGQLKKWNKRYNIRQLTICGESRDMQGKTTESWKEQLPEIVQGYKKGDIWYMDETGVFGRLYRTVALDRKGRSVKEAGRASKG